MIYTHSDNLKAIVLKLFIPLYIREWWNWQTQGTCLIAYI